MLDENRIRLMTRMASYEENEGKKTIPIAQYFRGDYVSYNVVKSVIGATIAFVLITAAYIYYHMETMLSDIYKFDLATVGKSLLSIYLIVIGVYFLIALVVYSIRYDNAKKSLNSYYQALRKISLEYEDEEQE